MVSDPAGPDVNPAPAEPTYPLNPPGTDARFSFGLLLDVVDVLQAHGYPRPTTGADLVALQQALFRFLYGPPTGTREPA